MREIGKENIVIDLSCRLKDGRYHVVTDRWQTFSHTLVNGDTLNEMSHYASEFLIHGVDVEGKQAGIDQPLIELLAAHESHSVCLRRRHLLHQRSHHDQIYRKRKNRCHHRLCPKSIRWVIALSRSR